MILLAFGEWVYLVWDGRFGARRESFQCYLLITRSIDTVRSCSAVPVARLSNPTDRSHLQNLRGNNGFSSRVIRSAAAVYMDLQKRSIFRVPAVVCVIFRRFFTEP
ncbi:hypothetical protein CY34DRAFT_811152 [Suillus luteus UH-Slu-Lm8-n1]|uniref:Uncharacterized protein n=1 Tax=Suillus luteus UH-Slu-Lm8-n1 TaxID=930992 RepID=A0A0C9ZGV0_9AGAM|nr:hypothetical protein CY34DRAFT_811152 [Suillus luteus UH-Slu-Lm8-n1]